jgi:hypothetical protein
MAKTTVYKCPKCKFEAEIKGNHKIIRSSVNPSRTTQGFPTHSDCELARPIKKMDFSKLTKVKEE